MEDDALDELEGELFQGSAASARRSASSPSFFDDHGRAVKLLAA
jgi:hypothetical protein